MSKNQWNFLNQEFNIKDKSLIMIKLIFGKCWNSLETNEPKPTLGVRFLKPKKQFTLLPKNTLNVDYSLKCKENKFYYSLSKRTTFQSCKLKFTIKTRYMEDVFYFSIFLVYILEFGSRKVWNFYWCLVCVVILDWHFNTFSPYIIHILSFQ